MTRLIALLLLAVAGWPSLGAAATPCGAPVGPGYHAVPEVPRTGTVTHVSLTVRQDGYRLCFVWNGQPTAPVIRLRPGDHLVLHITNEISDPCYIQNYFGGTCPAAAPAAAMPGMDMTAEDGRTTPAVALAGYYPIEPDMAPTPSGATNNHVHGMAVSPAYGQDEVLKTDIATPAQAAGGQGKNSFTYDYAIPASHPAGLYWYHPHHHGETEPQAMMGLTGAIVVEDAVDDARQAAGIPDVVLIMRNVAAGQVPAVAHAGHRQSRKAAEAVPAVARSAAVEGEPAPADPQIDEADEVACPSTPNTTLFTRFTFNGALVAEGATPLADLPTLAFTAKRQLFRLLNAAADDYVVPTLTRISATGTKTPVELLVVARDGVRLTDANGKPIIVAQPLDKPLVVPPGGRVEFLADAPPAFSTLLLGAAHFDTGCTGNLIPARRLLALTPDTGSTSLGAAAARWPAGQPAERMLPPVQTVAATRTFAFTEYPHAFTAKDPTSQVTDFYITEIAGPGMTTSNIAIKPFDMSGAPDITIALNGKPGVYEDWTIQNYTVEAHAFHIHQVHFQQVVNGSTAGQPLLDTIHVPHAKVNADGTPGAPGQVTLRLYFPAALAGKIVYHCHLLYHEDNGMMGTLLLKP